MDDYLWRNRPLLVFAPDAANPLIAAQRAALARETGGLTERDMTVIVVAGEAVTVDGAPAPKLGAAALRARYGVAADAAEALLVGKDGGVKRRQSKPFDVMDLFDTIDAMPMRQQEMQ